MRRRRSSLGMAKPKSADAVVAATAGEDTWKTWAGRSHGGAEFEFMDLIRGAKRSLQHTFLSGPPPAGTTCPVCFCEPDHPSEWHVTSSCSHAVCVDCLQGYATSQIQDPMHTGPLKCPVCPQVLRRKDAIAALRGDPELIRLWDEKIRNQLLRALPAYRPCPKCSERGKGSEDEGPTSSQSNSTSAKNGGGFVTPACLAPQFQERRETATRIIHGIWMAPLGLAVIYSIYVSYIGRHPSESALVDLFFMLSPFYFLVKSLKVSQILVAKWARRAFFRPISVECPCCDETFLLPAQTKEVADEESKQWIGAHTRPCPSCSVPISKTGGCNHMNCPSCRASFCWACMQLRTDCRAYSCRRGAQYGNAIPGAPGNIGRGPRLLGGSILDTIDYILDERRSQMPQWSQYEVGAFAAGLALRKTWFLQSLVQFVMTAVAAVFANGILSLAVLVLTVWKVLQFLSERQRRGQRGREHLQEAYALAGMDADNAAAIAEVLHENATDLGGVGANRANPIRRRRRRNSLTGRAANAMGSPPTSPRPTSNRHRHIRRNSQTASEFLLGADDRNQRDRERDLHRNMSEREMLQEALRRSVRDQ